MANTVAFVISGPAAGAPPPALRGFAAAAQAAAAPQPAGNGLLSISALATAAVATAALSRAGRRAARGERRVSSAVALGAGPSVLEGTGGPFGHDFWDPAGLAAGKSDEELLYWRASELKHGRVAMVAVVGWFHVASGYHPIGDLAARVRTSDDPLINAQQLPLGGALQVFFFILALEWLTTFVCKPPKSKPWDVLGWTPVIADENYAPWKESQLQELNNGRLAMIAIIGLISQDLLTGDYFGQVSTPCFGLPVCGNMNILEGFQMPGEIPRTPYPDYPEVAKMTEIMKNLKPLEVKPEDTMPADLLSPYYLKQPGGYALLQVPPASDAPAATTLPAP